MADPIRETDAIQPQNPTGGFGPRESADETRQAQHSLSNDAPTDVNCNAALARAQASTFALLGANFEASAMRFNGIMGHMAGVLAAGQTPPVK